MTSERDCPPAQIGVSAETALVIAHDVRIRGPRGEQALADRRAAAVLAMLAVEGNVWAHRLAETLWPEASTAQALMALGALRIELTESAGLRLIEGVELLQLAAGIAVRIGASDHDLDHLADEHLAPRLLGAYAYDDLAELADWLRATQQRSDRVARMRYTDLSFESERCGDLASAIAYAQRALALDRRCEDCLLRLMQLLTRAGQPAVALATYARSDALMRRRHGTPLSNDVRCLADDIARTRRR